MIYIGRKMIEDGLMAKVIIPSITESENLKITIGDYSFNALNFCTAIPETYWLAEHIKCALDAMYHLDEYFWEYKYYYDYLCSHI